MQWDRRMGICIPSILKIDVKKWKQKHSCVFHINFGILLLISSYSIPKSVVFVTL